MKMFDISTEQKENGQSTGRISTDEGDGKEEDDELQRCLPLKKRHPTCARCRNHGLIIDLKGHKRHCKYHDCHCSRCVLVTQRRLVMAKQVALSREHVRKQRNNRPATLQIRNGQQFYHDIEQSPQSSVIDVASESPHLMEMTYPVIQPSPDSTNTGCIPTSEYSAWDSSSQSTQKNISTENISRSQISRHYPSTLYESKPNDVYQPEIGFTANNVAKPSITSLPFESSVIASYTSLPNVNIPSFQCSFRQAPGFNPSYLCSLQTDESYQTKSLSVHQVMLNPEVSYSSSWAGCFQSQSAPTLANHSAPQSNFITNSAVQPVMPNPTLHYDSIDALTRHYSIRTTAPSINLSVPCSTPYQTSQGYSKPFYSSRGDETNQPQDRMMANFMGQPVHQRAHQSIDTVSVYNDYSMSANQQLTTTGMASASSPAEGDTLSTLCYRNITDERHYPHVGQSDDLSRVPQFQEEADPRISHPLSIKTGQKTLIIPENYPQQLGGFQQNNFQMTTPYLNFQIEGQYQSDPQDCSHLAATSQHQYYTPTPQSCNSFVQPLATSTSEPPPSIFSEQQEDSSVHLVGSYFKTTSSQDSEYTSSSDDSDDPSFEEDASEQSPNIPQERSSEQSYKLRRPFPLRITIPSLLSNQSSDTSNLSPLDPSPTFSPASLSLLSHVTLPTNDIPSPGFFTSSLPSFNYPSPTLPTQTSPVFSYPSPYTNPSNHANTTPLPGLPDPSLPVIEPCQPMSSFAEQVRIPPKHDN